MQLNSSRPNPDCYRIPSNDAYLHSCLKLALMSVLPYGRGENGNIGNSKRSTDEGDVYLGDQRYNIIGGRDNFNQVNVLNDSRARGSRGFDKLCDEIAENALHNSGEVSDQPKCHPGTRVAILDYLLEWTFLPDSLHQILWLHGPAGAGKSSILRTIAQLLFQKGLLLGSFFFFRRSNRRDTSRYFISTLAYQLALSIPEARRRIGEAVEENPRIFSLSLWDQAAALIVSPLISVFNDPDLRSRQYPRIIVIDGLDECKDQDKQCQLLDVLRRIVQSVPISLSVLIASRPEHHIRHAFNIESLNLCSSRLALDDSYEPDQDIKKYILDNLKAVRRERPLEFATNLVWPSPEAIQILVAKASGQFIYASTVVKYVSSPRYDPAERLNIVLGAITAGKQKPFEQLDKLYSIIFSAIDEDILAPALRVLGILLLPGFYLPVHQQDSAASPAYIERFLQLNPGDVRRFLFDLESLLTFHENHQNIQFYHASLSDYIFDSSRSGKFWIDAGLVYADIVQQCLFHLQAWPNIASFLSDNITYLCHRIKSTPKLSKTIKDCDFDTLMTMPSESTLYVSRYLCPAILQLAKKILTVEDFRGKLLEFQNVVSHRIAVYFRNVRLKAFLVVLILADSLEENKLSRGRVLSILQDDREDELLEMDYAFNLSEFKSSDGFLPILRVLKLLLDEPESPFYMDAAQYADVTTHVMQHWYSEITDNSSSYSDMASRNMLYLSPLLLSKSTLRSDLLSIAKKIVQSRMCSTAYGDVTPAFEAYLSRAPITNTDAAVTNTDAAVTNTDAEQGFPRALRRLKELFRRSSSRERPAQT